MKKDVRAELTVAAYGWWFFPRETPPGYKGIYTRENGCTTLFGEEGNLCVTEHCRVSPELEVKRRQARTTALLSMRVGSSLARSLTDVVTNPFRTDTGFVWQSHLEQYEGRRILIVLGHCGGAARHRLEDASDVLRAQTLVAYDGSSEEERTAYRELGVAGTLPRAELTSYLFGVCARLNGAF